MDGRFCIFFSLFVADRNKYGILVNNIVDSYCSTLCHLNAMASTFVQSVENPQCNVDVCINSALAKAIEEDAIHCSARMYFILWMVMLGT